MNEYDELKEEENENDEQEYTTSYKLNSYGIDFDVNGLVRRQKNNNIYLPDFQRNYVWTKNQASKFIESLLLGLPIPSICLYKEESNKQIIIDGFQRLHSIRLFYQKMFSDNSIFRLVNVSECFNGKTIDDLDDETRRKLDDTTIHATIVKADDPIEKNYNAVYLIFERLNTGGVKLTPQEIRNCIYHGSFKNILEEVANEDDFKKLLNISPKRKKDQEVVLRLFALQENFNDYTGNMKEFLNNYMDKNKNKNNDSFSKNIETFKKTIHYLNLLPREILKPSKTLNLAILDAIFVGTFHTLKNNNILDAEKYQTIVANLINKGEFIQYIETGKTHHSATLKNRINMAIKEISELGQ